MSKVPHTDGAVMSGSLGVPVIHEASCTDGEFVTAVGVANLENRTGNGFSFGDEEFDAVVGSLYHTQEGDEAVFDRHLHRKAAADLAMIDL